jgi:hypothetical protein
MALESGEGALNKAVHFSGLNLSQTRLIGISQQQLVKSLLKVFS